MYKFGVLFFVFFLFSLCCAANRVPLESTKGNWDKNSFSSFSSLKLKVHLDVPNEGYLVEEKLVKDYVDENQIYHTISIVGNREVALRIDVFLNQSNIALKSWFENNMSFLIGPDSEINSEVRGAFDGEVYIIKQPRTPQTFARVTAVFNIGQIVFRVTCDNIKNEEHYLIFQHIISSLTCSENINCGLQIGGDKK